VLFPDGSLPNNSNGGYKNQKEFLHEAIRRAAEMEVTVTSKPRSNILIDYKGLHLIAAFPLQFPFGFAGLPDEFNDERRRKKKVEYLSCLKHYSNLSIPAMHHAQFILVLHNICERKYAIETAFFRCRDGTGETTFAEQVVNISALELNAAVEKYRTTGQQGRTASTTADRYLNTIQASCRRMGNSEESAHTARNEMFGMMIHFGMIAAFLTVSPDDSSNYRVRINSSSDWVSWVSK
jgi:hypothetical protein